MIVSCEHNSGRMGMCSSCANAVSSSTPRVDPYKRREQLERAISACEAAGEYEEAARLRQKLYRF